MSKSKQDKDKLLEAHPVLKKHFDALHDIIDRDPASFTSLSEIERLMFEETEHVRKYLIEHLYKTNSAGNTKD
jgi:hypothetical protein